MGQISLSIAHCNALGSGRSKSAQVLKGLYMDGLTSRGETCRSFMHPARSTPGSRLSIRGPPNIPPLQDLVSSTIPDFPGRCPGLCRLECRKELQQPCPAFPATLSIGIQKVFLSRPASGLHFSAPKNRDRLSRTL